jgi:hypothetical protein
MPLAATTAKTPLPDAPLGLYPPSDFRLAIGEEAGPALIPQARFLFQSELLAIAREGAPVAEIGRGIDPFEDIRRWAAHPGPPTVPAMVWIAAPERKSGVNVAPDGKSFEAEGTRAPLALVPRIELNRSYADASTFAYLSRCTTTMRGGTRPDGCFVARTFWPEDWKLDAAAPVIALPPAELPQLAVRALMRATPRGGAESPFATQVLWERSPGLREWAGRPVIGVMVNGAQGDDDEAWGGHFALASGHLPADGRISDLLVANFYSLDVESEKGILPALAPLDNYLGDLNSGQAWYRPSYFLLAILKDERAGLRLQGALNRLYPQFWRRQLNYRHATMNCTSISIDVLRALGWNVPARAPASTLLAWLSIPAMMLKEGRISVAQTTYEYLTEDRTRLMPAAAFENATSDLLRLARDGAGQGDGELAKMLAADLIALVAMRIPQLPSSRKLGTWPVASPREYAGAVPHDPAEAQIIPLPPRHFPEGLLDADLLPHPRRRSTVPLIVCAATGILLVSWLASFFWRPLRLFLLRR